MTSVSISVPEASLSSNPLEQHRTDPAVGPGHAPVPPSPLADSISPLDGASPAVALYPMPDSGAAPLLSAVNHARRSVDLSCYLVTDARVVKALGDAARRGVSVRVMMEPHPLEFSTYAKAARELRASGVQVRTTPPDFDRHQSVDHAKFLTVDDQELWLGSGNLTRTSLGGGAYGADRDFWLRDRRPESVVEGETLFDRDWSRESTAGIHFQNLVVSPDNAEGKVLGLMDRAERRLLVYNPDLSNARVLEHLAAAEARGVDVEVLTAPTRPGDAQAQSDTRALRRAGIPVREVKRPHLHAKAMVADDEAFVGSQNFSVSGLYRNRELGEIVQDPAVVEELVRSFRADQSRG